MSNIQLQGIRKSYGGNQVIDDLTLEIFAGEFLTVLGPSGCGKSTMLRIIAGLEQQDQGSVAIGDTLVDHMRPKARDIAMVFQSYALYPHLTVRQNMSLPLRMRRLAQWQRLPFCRYLPAARRIEAQIGTEIEHVAEALEIRHLLSRKPGQLSGGQRQRVAVGRAMVRDPAVFLMDEPLSNLDSKLRVQMRSEIKELHKRLGATFVYVTHDQSEAMTLSDRVAVMLGGEVLQIASPQTIYSDPEDLRVAEFVGSPKINVFRAEVKDAAHVELAGTIIPVKNGQPAGTRLNIAIRPEAFRLNERSTPITISGSILFVEHMGSDLFAHLQVTDSLQPVIARLAPVLGSDLAPGKMVNLALTSADLMMFNTEGKRLRPDVSVSRLREYA